MKTNIYETLEKETMQSDLPEAEKNKQLSRLLKARGQKINILLTGATGSGKSSTINSLFDTSVAKVGVGVAPETDDIECYRLDNLTIWDSPGLGDSIDRDRENSLAVVNKLSETDENGVPIIDLVVVVIDASSKDLGTTYNLINNILIPSITPENKDRVIIAVNQSDMAMKGNHWDGKNNCPDDVLKKFLEEKCDSVRGRIKDATGFDFDIMYYCAGYTGDDGEQKPAYNLTKLLYKIVLSLPVEKRIAIAENLNDDKEMWEYDDGEEDYCDKITEGFAETVFGTMSDYAEKGIVYGGAALGMPGAAIGAVICGTVGAVVGVFRGLLK